MGPGRGKGTGEQALFRRLLDCPDSGDVVLADRYHCTYWTLAMLKALGVDVLTRQHQLRLHDFRRGKRLGRGDHIAQWRRPQQPDWRDEKTYAEMPEELSVREVKVRGRVLVTTLLDAHRAAPEELDRLYPQRWHVELDSRERSRSSWAWTSCVARLRRWYARKWGCICSPIRWCVQ